MKKLETNDIVLFKDNEQFNPNSAWCHTGSPELDFNIGTFGFPVGLTEIAGKSRSGKTTLGLMGMKFFQKRYPEGISIILSSERRDNKSYAKKIGVDVDNVIIIKSWYVEDLFYKLQIQLNNIKEVWASERLEGKPKVFIMWDSIGATLSRAEVETAEENVKIIQKNIEKGTNTDLKHAQMAAFAKNSKQLVKSLIGQLYDNEMIMVGINHTGVDFQTGNRKSFGGEWVEYLPCLRLETSIIEHIKLSDKDGKKDIEVEVGQKTKVKIVKNDFGSRKPTIIEIMLGYGVVLSQNDIDFALEHDILEQEGAKKISFMNDKLKWSTKREFYQNYIDENKCLPLLHKKIMELRHKMVLESKNIDEDFEQEDDEDNVQESKQIVKPKVVLKKKLIPRK